MFMARLICVLVLAFASLFATSSCVASVLRHYDIEDVSTQRYITSPIHVQENLGSCSSVAVASAAEQQLTLRGINTGKLSSMFLHWNSRNITDLSDYTGTGASLMITLLTLDTFGTPNEETWPYIISNWKTRPPEIAFTEAFTRSNMWSYTELNVSDNDVVIEMTDALRNSDSVVLSIKMWKAIYDVNTDDVIEKREDALENKRHAVLVVAWSKSRQAFLVRNSWGTSWGTNGHMYVSTGFVKSHMLVRAWSVRARF
jgi:C1A family cysteine protease